MLELLLGPVVTVMNKRGVNTVKPVLGSPPVLITTIFTSIKWSPCVKESILPAQVANQNTGFTSNCPLALPAL